jgi:hypothetical protein
MPAKYTLSIKPGLLKDEASVKRHIAADDYFGTIATILSLIKQEIKKHPTKQALDMVLILKNIEEDLMFLQKNCHIHYRPIGSKKNSSTQVKTGLRHSKPKIKNINRRPKGRLISQ